MTAERPLVSIVTPSLNQGRFLREALESVRDQTYAPVEHIVVDGGSTDDTLEILRAASRGSSGCPSPTAASRTR